MRAMWSGEMTSHRGRYYTVENARLYTLPEEAPRIHVAGSGPRAAELAARIGDGFIGTGPDKEVLDAYQEAGGDGPRFAQVTVCWAANAAEARQTARAWWPTVAVHGAASQELANPKDFEDVSSSVTEEDVAKLIPCGPDPQPILEAIDKYVSAGYDHVYLHQVGPDQRGFLDFAAQELLPVVTKSAVGGARR